MNLEVIDKLRKEHYDGMLDAHKDPTNGKDLKSEVEESSEESIDSTQEDAKEEDLATEAPEVSDDIEVVRAEYEKVLERKVPNNKKNDIEWLKSKIAEVE